MFNKTKHLLIIVILSLVITNAVFAYVLSNETLVSVAGETNSTNFSMRVTLKSAPIGNISNSSYSLKTGFMPAIFEALGPLVTAIIPATGYNIAPISVKISGARFADGITMKLTKTGENDISGTNVVRNSSAEVICNFDLSGKTVGQWNVVVTDSTNSSNTLSSGFEIKSYPLSAGLAVNSPNPFDPARESTTIIYKLDANAAVNIYLFNTTAALIYKGSIAAGENGGRTGDNSIAWNGINNFNERVSNGVYLLHVVERSTGKTLAKGKIAVLRR